ncbi:MAG: protein kinase [Acidobacteriota bacterium]
MSAGRKLWQKLFADRLTKADRLLQEGQLEKAAREYARAGHLGEAARIAAKLGQIEQAFGFYEDAGMHLEAAELMESEGHFGLAVDSYRAAQLPLRAAAAAEKAGQPLRAAAIYERNRNYRLAAASYSAGGDHDGALRCLEIEASDAGKETDVEVEKLRARALVRLGRRRDAAEILREIDPTAAASLLAQAGAEEEAAEMLEHSGISDRSRFASNPSVGDSVKARVLERASAAQIEESIEVRIERLIEGGELRQAADLLLDEGGDARAAELLERVGDVESAAGAYSRAGDMESAARCFELAGKPKRAAGCLLLANEPIRAAEAFLAAMDPRSALAAVHAIDEVDPRYEEATLLLAPSLHDAGEWDELLRRLAALPRIGRSRESVLERRYWQGRCLHSLGRRDEAERNLQAVVELDRGYRDARRRLRMLQQQPAAEEVLQVPKIEGALATGKILKERYELQEQIGQGGMSVVFRAHDRLTGRVVAVKAVSQSQVLDPTAEERLLREAQLCQRIQHENVVEIVDLGRYSTGVFVAMELLPGLTLETLINEKRVFPVVEALGILQDVLAGLEAVHQAGVIHRDIKPANLAVTPDRVKIMDFGIALAPGDDVALTQPGQVMGSPLFMSPEQIQGLELDARSDLYSFGVVCFTLLAGREPFTGKTPADVVLKHLGEPPPDLTALRPDLPEELAALVERLLAKTPNERPASAAIVAASLEMLG